MSRSMFPRVGFAGGGGGFKMPFFGRFAFGLGGLGLGAVGAMAERGWSSAVEAGDALPMSSAEPSSFGGGGGATCFLASDADSDSVAVAGVVSVV